MRICVLASGSSGNATFIQMGETKLLVDAGISARRIQAELRSVGVAASELNGILITHEHRDHIAGLATMTKKYRIPVYARTRTLYSMGCRTQIDQEYQNEIMDCLAIGGVRVQVFNVPHDAADPVGYSFFYGGKKCTVATDIGFVTETVQKALDDSDAVVLESNHDVELLRNGSYPRPLKQRILSNRGHLSNQDAAWALVRMKKKRHVDVFLAHLSDENNRPELAYQTVATIVKGQGYDLMKDLNLYLTRPDAAVALKAADTEMQPAASGYHAR